MDTKILGAFLLGILTLVLSVAMISAVTFTPSINSAAYTATINTTGATVTYTQILNDQSTPIAVTSSIANQTVTFSTSPNYAYLSPGRTYAGSALIVYNATLNETVPINIVKTFCVAGRQNATGLSIDVDISNSGQGDGDEGTWYPRDSIEISVDFNNDATFDLEDVILKVALINKATGVDVTTRKLDWISSGEEEKKIGDIDADESGSYTFKFIVSNELTTGDYALMVKAYPKNQENETCIDESSDLGSTYYQDITVDRESEEARQVIFEDISVEPSEAPCSTQVTISAKAYNIGDTDQEAIKVKLYNRALNVNLYEVIENFKMDDSQTVEFTFDIPGNATEDSYIFNLNAVYAYDEDDDKDNSDDAQDFDDASFSDTSDTVKATLSVKGSCIDSVTSGTASITAELSSETPRAVIGSQTVVEAVVKNTGTASASYTISVSGVSSWAEVSSIEPETFTLEALASMTVQISLDVDSSTD